MCGIFCLCSYIEENDEIVRREFMKISSRGPDNSSLAKINKNITLGFHRLSINGLSEAGNQPFHLSSFPSVWLICNGEIYNHKDLAEIIGYTEREGTSDCEIIIPLYKRYGFEKTLQLLDGVFAIILYDEESQTLYVGRDRFGVRPLFMNYNYHYRDIKSKYNIPLIVASEMKAIINFCGDNSISQVKPGTWSSFYVYDYGVNRVNIDIPYYIHKYIQNPSMTEEGALSGIRRLLRRAVDKRMMSDRPIACLLSGGLDSSLITALVKENCPHIQLETFSIGLKNSTDIKFARLVAKHLGTKHTEIILSEEEFLNEIPNIVYITESYDTTTIRASTGNYLVSKYISEHSNSKVIFCGDGSDELCGSYLYFKNAPTRIDFQFEVERLLKDIAYFDVLRSDKSISSNGLEARVPFLDKDFVNFFMSIPIELRMATSQQEKYLLRKAFSYEQLGYHLLPSEVLWRQKEAFSDGVSGKERSWWEIIQEEAEKFIDDEELNDERYPPQTRKLKESVYYMKLFDQYYPNQRTVIPYYWLPKWSGETVNPSARVLSVYNE